MKKEVLRRCVASNERKNRNELFRVVRISPTEVKVDLTNKINGRGAYISKDKELILKAKKKNLFAKELECEVSLEIYDELIELL